RRGEAVVADRFHRQRPDAAAEAGVVRRAVAETVFAAELEVGDLAPPGVYGNPDVLHLAARDLPRERQPVVEPVLNPIGGELGRQEQVESAGLLAEAAQLDRANPLAVQLVSETLAQSLTDVRPVRREIQSFLIFHVPLNCIALGRSRPACMRSHANHRACSLPRRPSRYVATNFRRDAKPRPAVVA